ncbi:hypothetical protein [Halomonas aquatica]|uniref:Uncharacterized protein n=1 Tax=Halomonas aquatica TaxID=3151123 RepID=A0ABV1NAD8_9GAMM
MTQSPSSRPQADIAPVDVLAGLGGAERDVLATFLALFDDSKIRRRLVKRAEDFYEKVSSYGKTPSEEEFDVLALPAPDSEEIQQNAREIGQRQAHWQHSEHSDDMLRLLLWIRLRDALDLPAQLTSTHRGCHYLADDMVARLLQVLDPPNVKKSSRRWLKKLGRKQEGGHTATLSDIVVPVLDELLSEDAKAKSRDTLSPDAEQRHQALAEAVSLLGRIDADRLERFLDEASANSANDAAMRNTAILGSSLTAVGVGVGVSGFAPYLLAAQASAFIPVISGPTLVSFVSVISNPITILAATATAGVHFVKKAEDRVNAHVAARVISLLALTGLQKGHLALNATLQCFTLTPYLPNRWDTSDKLWGGQETIDAYQAEWQRLAELADTPNPRPSAETERVMARHVESVGDRAPAETASPLTGNEAGNLAAMAGLTLGDVLYNLAAIEPEVIQAADFSRTADIDSRLDFATLAEQIQGSSQVAALGATSHLQGYVAEQAVAAQLMAQGHTVSLPETANNPGWDLLVDGQPMQVKFHDSLAGLHEHFARYDIPVIANTELDGRIPEEWSDQVFFLEGLSNARIEALTTQSLEAGAEVFSPDVVPAAALITITRSVLAYQRGQLSARQTLEQIMLDGGVRIGLASAGGLAGPIIGGFMFGPAGALVFASGGPILAQSLTPKVSQGIKHHASGETYRVWQAEAHIRLDALHGRLLNALTAKREQIDTKLERCPDNSAGDYLRWRLNDDRRHTQEMRIHLLRLSGQDKPKAETRLRETLELLASAGLHPAHYQAELRAVTEHFGKRPGLGVTAKDWTRKAGETVLTGASLAGGVSADVGSTVLRKAREKRGGNNPKGRGSR